VDVRSREHVGIQAQNGRAPDAGARGLGKPGLPALDAMGRHGGSERSASRKQPHAPRTAGSFLIGGLEALQEGRRRQLGLEFELSGGASARCITSTVISSELRRAWQP